MLAKRRHIRYTIENLTHHRDFLQKANNENVTPEWLEVRLRVEPSMSYATDILDKLQQAKSSFPETVVDLIDARYQKTTETLATDLDELENDLRKAIREASDVGQEINKLETHEYEIERETQLPAD